MDLVTLAMAKSYMDSKASDGAGTSILTFDGNKDGKPYLSNLVKVSDTKYDVSKIVRIVWATRWETGDVSELLFPLDDLTEYEEAGVTGLVSKDLGIPVLGYAEPDNVYGAESGFYVYCKDVDTGDGHTFREYISFVAFEQTAQQSGGGGLPVVTLTTVLPVYSKEPTPLTEAESKQLTAAAEIGLPAVIQMTLDVSIESVKDEHSCAVVAGWMHESEVDTFLAVIGLSAVYLIRENDAWAAVIENTT